MKTLIMEVRDDAHLENMLIELSNDHGGAWVFTVKSFTHTVKFIQYQNPSSVPDSYHDLTQGTMGYKGQIRGFTKAARIREQNRGLGRA